MLAAAAMARLRVAVAFLAALPLAGLPPGRKLVRALWPNRAAAGPEMTPKARTILAQVSVNWSMSRMGSRTAAAARMVRAETIAILAPLRRASHSRSRSPK